MGVMWIGTYKGISVHTYSSTLKMKMYEVYARVSGWNMATDTVSLHSILLEEAREEKNGKDD